MGRQAAAAELTGTATGLFGLASAATAVCFAARPKKAVMSALTITMGIAIGMAMAIMAMEIAKDIVSVCRRIWSQDLTLNIAIRRCNLLVLSSHTGTHEII
jgi:hypothetical protein